MRTVTIVVEGVTDEPFIRRIVGDHKLQVSAVYGKRGKGDLDKKLPAFNNAARFHGSWLVVRDLDMDAPCAAALVRTKLRHPSPGMLFRIAVRSTESWLLADVEGVVSFFKVRREDVPNHPEALPNPKRALILLASKSRSRQTREEMVPRPGATAMVGPGYVSQLSEFASREWSWDRAARRSDSLRRCVARVAALAGT